MTGGSTLVTEAWDAAKGAVGSFVDGATYVAGFFVGLLEGAYNAIVDLFKGAVDMVEAVLEVVWNLVSGNPGASSAEIVEKEIEARLMMIRYRHKWGITADEIREMIQEVRMMRKTGRY